MNALPFSASVDALAFIVKAIRYGASFPEASELVPVLDYCLNSTGWEEATNRVIESIPYGHFMVCWHLREELNDATEVTIWGRRLFVPSDTVNRLKGRRLVLRSVDRGGREISNGERHLLVASIWQLPRQL